MKLLIFKKKDHKRVFLLLVCLTSQFWFRCKSRENCTNNTKNRSCDGEPKGPGHGKDQSLAIHRVELARGVLPVPGTCSVYNCTNQNQDTYRSKNLI